MRIEGGEYLIFLEKNYNPSGSSGQKIVWAIFKFGKLALKKD